MTADAIAQVLADLRTGRVRNGGPADPVLFNQAQRRFADAVVVDATAIYESLVAKDDPVAVYEDHPCIAPPWPSAAVSYVNEHGNVVVMQTLARRHNGGVPWQPADPIDWPRVRWIIDVTVWVGGRSGSTPVRTTGPMHLWRFAVYDGGQPADLRWYQLRPEIPLENWDMAHLVILGTLNFMNCRNVDLVEPERPRAQRRRLERLGVRVNVINVFPVGRSSRGGAGSGEGAGVPLTSVRGHFAHYGPKYGRGLLFGKYECRIWVPQHARGDEQHGRVDSSYRLRTGQ